MSWSGPYFYAWCDTADVVDTLAAVLSALAFPRDTCSLTLDALGGSGEPGFTSAPIAQVVERVREVFTPGTHVLAGLWLTPPYGRQLMFDLQCRGAEYERLYPHGPLSGSTDDYRDLVVQHLDVPVGTAPRCIEVEAAIVAIETQTNMEDILLRVCAPDGQARVTTGGCALGDWDAPIELCATYQAESTALARDLALSWLALHDGAVVAQAAGLSMEALRSRVDGAPPGALVTVARDVEGWHERHRQRKADEEAARRAHVEAPPRNARVIVAGHDELTREHVLAALSVSPTGLLEALEAAAVPDEQWRSVEPSALEEIEAIMRGAPTYDVDVTTRNHVRFIEQHAPYHVRRLANGGVMLTTHPYRILWPLWADALALLGIREAT